jgi:hypothetical protein
MHCAKKTPRKIKSFRGVFFGVAAQNAPPQPLLKVLTPLFPQQQKITTSSRIKKQQLLLPNM